MKETRKIVIADLDGTIALIEHRRHWIDKDKHPELTSDERWRRFYAECPNDLPNWPVIETVKSLAIRGYRIEIFSGRSDEVRSETLAWLNRHYLFIGAHFHAIRMRPAGDFTPDEILKRQWIEEYDLADIMCVFDDRRKVVDMWRSIGLTCFQVAPGEF